MKAISLIFFGSFATMVAGYPAVENTVAPTTNVERRDCTEHIQAFTKERRMKRSQSKRSYYWWMLNSTCIASPEIDLDKTWLPGTPVRSDATEGQKGIQLLMDVGVMDMSTCQPMTNALVEIWGANALGQYGGTFLRGAQPTNEVGIAEINTIFPGFTPGNAVHLGVRVHPNWNGESSVTSSSSAYNGRMYFTDGWASTINSASPYNTNPTPQTINAQDPVWSKSNKSGYYPVIDTVSIQDDWPEGVVGYITVGVNPSASYSL